MAFADSGPKTILSGKGKTTVVLLAACEKGDVLGYAAGWYRADGNAAVPAFVIAAFPGGIGDTIAAFEAGVVYSSGFGATVGGAVFLSDTVGRVTQTPSTTNSQRIGFAASATVLVLNQLAYKPEFKVAASFPATVSHLVDHTLFIAPFPCRLMAAKEVHGVAASAGTFALWKAASGAAFGAGTLLQTAATGFDGVGTANTIQSATLAVSIATRCLATGDRVFVLASEALTSLVNGEITLQFQRL
jgi:hypothetical protein